MNNKDKILNLRKRGKSYNEISKKLNISKSIISYHCKSMGINEPINSWGKKIDDSLIKNIKIYRKNHTTLETAKKYNVSKTTVVKYCNLSRKKLTEEEKIRKNRLAVKNRIQKLKIMAVEYLGGKCIKCGYDKCIWAMDFHHRNPKEKKYSIGTYFSRSWEKLKKELDKCDLVCANCHREIHYEIYNK